MISVIISVYNEPLSWVMQSLNSIISQTYPDIQIILIIDNPKFKNSDEIEKVLNESGRSFKIIFHDTNLGLVDSLNEGLEVADGNYIARMDSDDISVVNRFEIEMNFLTSQKLDFVSSAISQIDFDGKKLRSIVTSRNLLTSDIIKIEKRQNIFWHPTWLMKKSVAKNLGGYRKIDSAEDYDFVIRAILSGVKVGQVKDITVLKRINNASISAEKELKQVLIARKIGSSFRKKQALPIKEADIDVPNQDNIEYIKIRTFFNNRNEHGILARTHFAVVLLFTSIGRAFLVTQLYQKYQIGLLMLAKRWGL